MSLGLGSSVGSDGRLRRLGARLALLVALTGGLLAAGPLFTQDSPRERGLAVWQGMDRVVLKLSPPSLAAAPRRLEVRRADEAAEWQQGMQYLPAATVRAQPIWFEFREPFQPAFHMRNVAIALDIAWVAPDGEVLAVERMVPETAGYSPPGPIQYVLETAAGQAARLGVVPGARLQVAE